MSATVRPTPSVRRVAVITGAEGGLGRATAEQLGADGYALVLGYLPGTSTTGIDGLPSNATLVATDVRDQESVATLMETACSRYGGIDLLVTLAGVMEQRFLGELDLATW